MAAPGYSGKSAAEKLGALKASRVIALGCPADYRIVVPGLPESLSIDAELRPNADFVHLFVTDRAELAAWGEKIVPCLAPKGVLWVSWPKKSSGIACSIKEQDLRDVLLPLGIVDVKVCAVTEIWSGLQFRWRRG